MRTSTSKIALVAAIVTTGLLPVTGPVNAAEAGPERVNVDNFKRAESDTYFSKFVKDGSLGEFSHERAPAPIDRQAVIRMNRDTLYSSAVADLNAGPATVTLPDAGGRFMSMQVINEDHYTPVVIYESGAHSFDKAQIGTRYVLFLVRTFVDPGKQADLDAVHALQDSIRLQQDAPGSFRIPAWDAASLTGIRNALNALAAANGGLDSARMFGRQEEVDPVQHLLGTAAGWGGNPVKEAYYAGVTPTKNDGATVHRLTVRDVPVDGFWSISVYNRDGFFEKNSRDSYSTNNVTAKPNADGSVTVQFGGCDGAAGNCIPVTPGWNYIVRMYRPRKAILDGTWKFPEATPVL
jgi:hypothetical protein